jgi:general secretion pathway protein F
MALFDYTAVSADARSVSGEIQATSERDALGSLASQGLTATRLVERRATGAGLGKQRVSPQDLALVVKEMATLARAGIPLAEAVASIAEAHQASDIGRGFQEVRGRLNAGESLSRSLAASGLKFPPYLAQLTQAAESAGTLPQALESASAQMLYEERIRQETRSALIYPAVLVCAGLGAILFIFMHVVPRFAPMLKSSRGKIPELSAAVIHGGVWMREHWLWILGGCIALVIGAIALLRNPTTRERILDAVVKLPVLGEWYRSTQIARWASIFGVLLESRVPIVKAMELSEVTVELPSLRSRLANARKNLRQGEKLAATLSATGLIKPTGINLIRVGEQSGELGGMLRSLAAIEDQVSQERKKRFLTLLEPACIIVIGSVIAFVMYAVISALMSLSAVVR